MDLWQLTVFCRVVELKSFSRAGKTVHLSQPTVSSHIKDLEDHFGCRLIDRLSREAVPTRAGELLYAYARRLLLLKEETEAALAEFQGTVKGRLRIGGSTIPGVYLLPRVMGIFTARWPDVTLSLVIGDTEEIIRETLAGTLEMGIVGARSEDKRIHQEKLVEDEMGLVVPGTHPWAGRKTIPLTDLPKVPFILRETGSGTLASFRSILAEKGHDLDELRVVAEMGSTEAVIHGIKNNVGVSILSTMAVAEDVAAGRLVILRIAGLDLRQRFYLTLDRNRTASPLCNAFLAFLREAFPRQRRMDGEERGDST